MRTTPISKIIDRVVSAIRSRKPDAIWKAYSSSALALHYQFHDCYARANAIGIGILIEAIVERCNSQGQVQRGILQNQKTDKIDRIVAAIRSRKPDAIRKASLESLKVKLRSLREDGVETIALLMAEIFARHFTRHYLQESIPADVKPEQLSPCQQVAIPADVKPEQLSPCEQVDYWDRLWRSRPPSVMRKKHARKRPAQKKGTIEPLFPAPGAVKLIESSSRLWREIRKTQSQAESDRRSNSIALPEPFQSLTAPIRDGERNPLPDPLPAPYKAPPLQAEKVAVNRSLRPKTRCG